MAKQPCFLKYLSFEITEVCPGFESFVGHCISLVSFVSKAKDFIHHRLWDLKKSSTSSGGRNLFSDFLNLEAIHASIGIFGHNCCLVEHATILFMEDLLFFIQEIKDVLRSLVRCPLISCLEYGAYNWEAKQRSFS